MSEDSLDRVKEAEDRATKLIDSANEDKSSMIADAKKQAIDIFNETVEHAEKQREKRLEKLKKDLIEEREIHIKEVEGKARKLKADVKAKIPKEVNFLFEKFLEAIG